MILSVMSLPLCMISLVATVAAATGAGPDPDCVAWFNRGKIKVGTKDCELQCATLESDMATFMCSDQCNILCKEKPTPSIVSKFIYYPGLTLDEKNLIAKWPKDAITVYKQKNIAESSSSRNFPNQDLNDEGDAFRHFIWAGLLTKELGQSKAKEFLDAHEADQDQPANERQMDLYNNSRGQAATEALDKEKLWSLRNLEAKGLDELRSKQLQVIKPGLPIPKEPK